MAEIRRLGPLDDALLGLALRTFQGPDVPVDERFLTDPSNLAFVGVDGDGSVTGWAWGHELVRPTGMRTMLLYLLETTDGARRDGLGRALLEAFVAEARERGHTKMWLFTDAGSEAAGRLYPGAGGAPGPRMGYWWVFE
jgi:GNAT superfamily N-acetyltransferase